MLRYEIIGYHPDGSPAYDFKGYTTYTWGEHGYIDTVWNYGPDDSPTGYGTHEYDFDNGISAAYEYTANDVLESFTVVEVNTSDDLVSVSCFEADGTSDGFLGIRIWLRWQRERCKVL